MTMDRRKLIVVAAPVVIGTAMLFILNRLTAERAISSPKPPAVAGESQTAAPQNSAHERAALEEQLKQRPEHVPILLRLGELEHEAGNSAAAVSYLKKVLAQEPQNEEARLELGRLLYDSGDVDGAIRETKQLLADHPVQVDGLYNLGAIYANHSRYDLAREYWTKAASLDPQSDSGRRAKDGLSQLGK